MVEAMFHDFRQHDEGEMRKLVEWAKMVIGLRHGW